MSPVTVMIGALVAFYGLIAWGFWLMWRAGWRKTK